MDEKALRERAEILAQLDYKTLEQGRRDAAARGDTEMATALHHALHARSKSQNAEIEHSGRLFEHIEQPSRENGGRYVTKYTGDISAWMSAYATPAAVGKINRDAGIVARQTVSLREGERVQIVGRNGPRMVPHQ